MRSTKIKIIGVIPGLPICWQHQIAPFMGGCFARRAFTAEMNDLGFDGCVIMNNGEQMVVDGRTLAHYSGEVIQAAPA